MGDIVNLNRFRKRKLDEGAREHADANAQRHGRTPAERTRAARERERQDALVDGARREPLRDAPSDGDRSDDPDIA